MFDFEKYVAQALKPSTTREEDACRELAGHLSDIANEMMDSGCPAELAVSQALAQLHHPGRLRRKIRRAKGERMSSLTSKVLLPGFVATCFVVPLGLFFERVLGCQPYVYLMWHHVRFAYYWHMMPLFFLGSIIGAWCSRYRGGNLIERFSAGMFFAIAGIIAYLVPLPFALAMDWREAWSPRLETVLGYMLSQVVVPGVPMLLGTLPFLLSDKFTPSDTATS